MPFTRHGDPLDPGTRRFRLARMAAANDGGAIRSSVELRSSWRVASGCIAAGEVSA